MKQVKRPLLREIRLLLIDLKTSIQDDYRSIDADPGDRVPSMDVTIGCDPSDGSWSYQTGDNSLMGSAYHYPVWAVITLTRRSNCAELARDIREQILEQVYDLGDCE